MKRTILTALSLLTLFVLPHQLSAGPRSWQQAQKIAERHAEKLGIIEEKSEVHLAKTAEREDFKSRKSGQKLTKNPAYYIFEHGKNKGFTIVSGDDRLPEIVGYADQGNYDENALPENYVSFMNAYQKMAEKLTSGDGNARQQLAEIENYQAARTTAKAVAPILGKIEWSQFAPYNNSCPVYDGVNRAATGCVATAMTQVMAHYQHPKQLKEAIPGYTKTWDGYTTTVPAISQAEGTYDWGNILTKYTPGNYSQAQANAVAKLLYHCGAALQMGYGKVSGSFASPIPFAKYFGYDADLMQKVFRYSFSLNEWMKLIDNELAAGRPILYAGTSSAEGGHEFVCDGSDGQGLYHINWGWSGQQNGYFDLSVLNPYYEGEHSGSASDGYNVGCSMLIGIAPDNGIKDAPLVNVPAIVMNYGQNSSKLELVKARRAHSSESFRLKISNYVTNQSFGDLYGVRVKFGIRKADGTYQPLGNSSIRLNLGGMGADGSYSIGQLDNFAVDYAFPVGKTTLYAIYSTNGYTWLPCAYKGMQPYVFEATETTLSVVKSQLSCEVEPAGELISGMKSSFNLKVTNDGDDEYQGYLNIYSNSLAEKPENISDNMYVAVPAHSTITRTLTLTPSGKTLHLWVTDRLGTVLVENKEFSLNTSTTPVLSIVKAWSNATPDVYETENAKYGRDLVKAPKVEDNQVTFSYNIQNDGAATTLMCGIGVNNTYPSEMKVIPIPGNGQVTTISKSFTPEQAGGRNIISELWVYDETGMKEMNIPTPLPNYKLWCVDESSSYSLSALKMVVYVAGKSTGGTVSIPNITLSPDQKKEGITYNLKGEKVDSSYKGICIRNGKKFIRK